MCGINGIYAYAGSPVEQEELLATRESMRNRGPDGAGLWQSPDGRVGLGHRRLSIIDLSPAGAQPMIQGDLALTFNGEIYNYRDLRAELEREGVIFRSHSDTEVLLHLYRRDGPAMLEHLRGMFALALWDGTRRRLFLARDPHGIKPLYYADDGRTFRFASQVKALLAGGAIEKALDPAGLVGFLLWGSVPEPHSLYRDIRLLPAGHSLMVDPGGIGTPTSYWDFPSSLRAGLEEAAALTPAQALGHFSQALHRSVEAHLVSDVPVGAFLSAGLDSTTLVGLARRIACDSLDTLTLTFDEMRGTPNDECPLAAEAARHLGVNHRCMALPDDSLEAELPAFFAAMDQPTVDGINTWFVSKAAAETGLKVTLSGLGGDELLGGYASFDRVPALVQRARGLRRFLPVRGWRLLFRTPLMRHLPANQAGLLDRGTTPVGAYHLFKGVFMPWELERILTPEIARAGWQELEAAEADENRMLRAFPPFAQVMILETTRYMRNQLLRDTDWVGMTHSLEIRVPLVDRTLSEAVAGMAALGVLGEGKSALASVLDPPLPRAILDKPKTGFTMPIWKWLRHTPGLMDWKASRLLRDPRLSDFRRWGYMMLHQDPDTRPLLRS